MDSNTAMELFDTFKTSGGMVKLYRVRDGKGNMICHSVQYRGSGQYFTSAAEVYAYCIGRGWIAKKQDPYHIFSNRQDV